MTIRLLLLAVVGVCVFLYIRYKRAYDLIKRAETFLGSNITRLNYSISNSNSEENNKKMIECLRLYTDLYHIADFIQVSSFKDVKKELDFKFTRKLRDSQVSNKERIIIQNALAAGFQQNKK